jgi:HemK-related putative methylase
MRPRVTDLGTDSGRLGELTGAAGALRGALEAAGYSRLYREAAGREYLLDPWSAFAKAREGLKAAGGTSGSEVFDLFLMGNTVGNERAEAAFGPEALRELLAAGLLSRARGGVCSDYRILSSFDHYLLIESPFPTKGGGFVSSGTYLSGFSYVLVRNAQTFLPTRSVLELGCGTGLLSIVVCPYSQYTLATDVDPVALQIARANALLNGCQVSTLRSDLFDDIPKAPFDLVVFNPPWRLVPPGVNYPNPLARVGRGEDGLDIVRRFLKALPEYLSAGGRAVFFADFPGNVGGFHFSRELEQFVSATRCSVTLHPGQPVTAEEQSAFSARTCGYLNERLSPEELRERFLSYYRSLGFTRVYPAECEVTNDGCAELSVRVPS